MRDYEGDVIVHITRQCSGTRGIPGSLLHKSVLEDAAVWQKYSPVGTRELVITGKDSVLNSSVALSTPESKPEFGKNALP